MPKFTTRVVLHDASWDDYQGLHKYMADARFSRTISTGDGTIYQLPDAEYDYRGNVTKDEVLEKASAAAARTGKKCAVLVTESAGRKWIGLEQIEP